MFMHPLQRLLDPTEVTCACVVEYAQADEVNVRCDAVILESLRARANNAGNVRAVRPAWAVIVRIGVVFLAEVPAADDAIIRPETATECDVVPSDAAIDDGHRLACARKSV